ncbi:peptide/nickel transport system substrate-binding protein [Palleronia aestuarii]|uniref:Peptide/nickel transport system substrate-binding protein n=1 Tax=Palleronia aestuarii TaxID=568105 RepID=A0A2W7NUX1_9RHOB|nr:ABC transporter substrate-binding protein [Palleronia aestuarii]PZX17146.1 peptide/nickel transport system substrate-binding protein [Palleronia aestuarii]
MTTTIRHLLAGAAALTLLAGAAGAQSITIAIGSEPSTLDPQLRDDGGERQVNDNIYETLMARTPEGELEPGLATEARQIDETTWEFDLREGVTFHNGEPFDADAVVASVERIIDPANNSEQMAYFGTIDGAEKVDDLTVRITTTGPDPILPSRMYWMKMVPPGHATDGDIGAEPVGTGPYRFGDWSRGESITLERNPDYWGEEPEVETATYRFVGEAGTRLSGLMAGEFDIITNLLPEFTQTAPKFAAVDGLETSVFVLGTDNEVVSNPKVREALNLAIDREAMVQALFQGYASIAQGHHVNPAAFGFNADLESYPYDPERARALIEEAGATGATIDVVGESGRWLKDREQIEAVAGYWAETGLVPNVQIQEFSQYLDSLMGDGPRPDSIFIANSNELLDADREASFIYHMDGAAASNSDAEMATMIDEARVTTDPEARQDLYDQVFAKGHDLNYTVPLFNLQDIYGMSERMEWQPRTDAKLLIKEMGVTE